MKKYLSIFAVLFTVILSSCSNDDIPVQNSISFKVDPSTVISSFEEYNVGDLTSLGTNYQLRIRLLVYNENGVLVESAESFSPDYTHIQTFNFNLSEGEYMTVAITDVVGKSSSAVKEYYTLSGQDKINTTTLSYTGYVAGHHAILGLTTEKQTIRSNNTDINIKVKPSGALIVCYIDNWNACLDFVSNGTPINVETYKLLGNQASSDLTLNNIGDPTYSIRSSSDFDYIWYSHPRNSQYVGGYGYCFKFPMKNVKLKWIGETSTSRFNWGEGVVLDIEAGKEYYFLLDVPNDEAEWYDLDISTKAPGLIQKASINKEKITDFNLEIEDAPISVKAIDYLKDK